MAAGYNFRTPTQRHLRDLWYAALNSEHGVRVEGPDMRSLKSQLYQARSALGDERLAALTLRASPDNPSKEVWIIFSNPEEQTDAS